MLGHERDCPAGAGATHASAIRARRRLIHSGALDDHKQRGPHHSRTRPSLVSSRVSKTDVSGTWRPADPRALVDQSFRVQWAIESRGSLPARSIPMSPTRSCGALRREDQCDRPRGGRSTSVLRPRRGRRRCSPPARALGRRTEGLFRSRDGPAPVTSLSSRIGAATPIDRRVERLGNGVHVVRLDRGRVVDPAVFAGAAAEPARVIRDHGAVRELGRQRAKPLAVIG